LFAWILATSKGNSDSGGGHKILQAAGEIGGMTKSRRALKKGGNRQGGGKEDRETRNAKPKTEILTDDGPLERSTFLVQGLQLPQAPWPRRLSKLRV
jgi:hypothetical protein